MNNLWDKIHRGVFVIAEIGKGFIIKYGENIADFVPYQIGEEYILGH